MTVAEEIRAKSDAELATLIIHISRGGMCYWCKYKSNCYASTDKKCFSGIKAFLGKDIVGDGK